MDQNKNYVWITKLLGKPLEDLFSMYRDITQGHLKKEFDNLSNKLFGITQPLLNSYEFVEDLYKVTIVSELL